MDEKLSKPYGLWPSPIKPASLAQSLRLADVAWDSDGQTLVWLEERSGRGVLVCAPPGQAPRDLTSTLSVRAMVGYGGGDLAVSEGTVYFVAQEGRLYRQRLSGGEAQPIVPQFGHMASPTPSPDGRWVIYVYTYERIDGLAIVDAAGECWPQKLVSGQDFYMQPCWHPDGRRVAWISWDHPNMPWDSTTLHLATLDASGPHVRVAAQETLIDKPDVAVQQPRFSPDGRSLAYISDEGGWGNLYLYDLASRAHRSLTGDAGLRSTPYEIGALAWVQGVRTYGFSPDGGSIYYVRNEAGFDRLWICDLASGRSRAADPALQAYSELAQIAVAPSESPSPSSARGSAESLSFVASSSTVSPRIVSWSPGSPVHIHRRSAGETVPPDELAVPEAVHWAAPNGEQVYGLYYPPTNSRFTGSALPPAIVNIHGGPTGQTTAGYNARAQFFATRGYAYLEVNYRGSTGYGKPYMAALRGKWGLLDVQDAIGGARHMVDNGLADEKRLVIMGGSAGGYTVLKTLVDHPGFFKAALCLYGVSNMFTLAADTHKFEERYLDSMLGALPEASNIYRERSPIFCADQIVDPIAVFQGEIDRVVPKAQSDTIVKSLRRRGIPHEYHVYPGEGHGWRKQETIEAFYTTVESFLKQYVIFA